jgi:hypothetical protein
VTAVFTAHAGKAIVQNAAVQAAVNHLLDIRTVKTILSLKPICIYLFKRFKVVLYALVIWRALRIALPVNRCRHEYRNLSQIMSKALFHRNTHAKITKRKTILKNQQNLKQLTKQSRSTMRDCNIFKKKGHYSIT